ncbi:SRPBCC domain-containing protein [Hyphobacterium sp. CCMP332]|nr:SRPBCC domain-containing protein [Hyphobacterium sp. CCMP332]
MAIIRVEAKVKADIKAVWNKWTKGEHVVHWNFASQDWECPQAENDLKEKGVFDYRMQAKDGSFGFNFTGRHLRIVPFQLIESELDDGRLMKVSFEKQGNEVMVIEEFEAESSNSIELQKQGWQAILDNFANYASD